MSPKKQTAIRLSAEQLRLLGKLSKKLGLTQSNVIRLAIQRLAGSEDVK